MGYASWFTTKKRLLGRCPDYNKGRLSEIRVPEETDNKDVQPVKEIVNIKCSKCSFMTKEKTRWIRTE
jgi:hypothetical protein